MLPYKYRDFICRNDIIFCGMSWVGVPRNEQSEFLGVSCAPSPTAYNIVFIIFYIHRRGGFHIRPFLFVCVAPFDVDPYKYRDFVCTSDIGTP